MRKFTAAVMCLVILGACSEHDPILPGVRTPVFATQSVKNLNTEISNLPDTADNTVAADCPYTQDASNVIWNGDKKIFSGFPTNNSVASNQKPVCAGGYVYAGLTTGEVVKVAQKSRKVIWIADVFRRSNMTGGASIVDIVAPIVVHNGAVYAGGLGDAFCRINAESGASKWCTQIGTAVPFIIAGNAIFVVATDGYLYALRTSDGAAYWRTPVEEQVSPQYANKIITVGAEKINAETGEKISK